jgi:hypothetical protein
MMGGFNYEVVEQLDTVKERSASKIAISTKFLLETNSEYL